MVKENVLSKYYSEIGEKLNELIPIEWKRVVMLAEVDDGWSSTTFYFIAENDTVYHWGDIFEELGVDEDEFDESFDELSKITEAFWDEFKNADAELWNSFTFDMTSDGKFKVDFTYDELYWETSTRERKTIWAYERLGLIPKDEYTKKILESYIEKSKKE